MSLHILADENIPAVEHYLGAAATVQRVSGRELQRSQLEGVDALLVRSVTRVDEELLQGSKVSFVGTATSGVDHIDRDYLQRQGIGFAHAPGSNANSVVEYVLAAIAEVPGKLEQLLAGGTVGIVGYGVIGTAMAVRLQALGINYRVYDPWLDQQKLSHPASLAEILACDVITLHAELTRRQPWPSFHLLGQAELGTLRPGCLLINACRGPVVDNLALLASLRQGLGPTSVLDVWEGEPDINSALLQYVTLGTAHIAGYSLDGKMLATRMLCEALTTRWGLTAPPQNSPAGEAPALEFSQTLTGAGLIRSLLRARYDIARDDVLLRGATAGADVAGAGRSFDLLRKEYGARRELLGSIVRAPFGAQQDMEWVRGLGCDPVSTAGGG